MPEFELSLTYEFEYLINKESAADRKKAAELAKVCHDRRLESIFEALPGFFDHSLVTTRDYFRLLHGTDTLPDKPGYELKSTTDNENLPEFIVKSFVSCFAEHMCSVLFPTEHQTAFDNLRYAGDDQNYGMEENIQDALLQLTVGTATEEWLDYWGKYFLGNGRSEGEPDDVMRQKIGDSINQPKNTIEVIRTMLTLYLGFTPNIYELEFTGIHNLPESPDDLHGTYLGGVAPGPLNDDFAHNQPKDLKRRWARIVVEIPTDLFQPPDDSAWVTDTKPHPEYDPPEAADIPGGTITSDNSFVRDPLLDGGPTPQTPMQPGDPAYRDEAYLYDQFAFENNIISLRALAAVVDSVKAAGVKVYYKIGNTYAII